MKKIVIDAGHGVHTAGKRCTKAFDVNETREWTINNAVATKVMKILEDYECEVIRTDDVTGEVDVSLVTRCTKANDFGADVFVSVHHNAADSAIAKGVEVYCCKTAKDSTVKLRDTMYDEIVKMNNNKGNRADGTREIDFFVLTRTNMSACLIENGFMSAESDVDLILSEDYQTKSAAGIVNALVKFLDLKKKVKVEVKQNDVGSKINIQLGILKSGMISNEVKTLQRLLNCFNVSNLSVDGNFGKNTLTAVMKFQTEKKINVDGCVGTETWNKLLK